jgi:glucoamylase
VAIVGLAPSPASIIGPYLTGGQKDLVTTALGDARVWATVGQGIVTEVYWPSVAEPQTRDLGFIVAGDGWWYEVKARNDYEFRLPDPAIPLGTAVHHGPPEHPYRLEVEVVPDPDRDALLVRFALSGVPAVVYVFLAAHLQLPRSFQDYSGGSGNTAWVDAAGRLNAWGEGRYLCLAVDGGFRRTSVGSFGVSDLWHDFAQNHGMTWTFTQAGPGFVVLAGQCDQQATLALAFANAEAVAQQHAADSLHANLDAVRNRVQTLWRDWAAATRLPAPVNGDPPGLSDAVEQSLAVIRAHEDRTNPGAVVAALTVPWGDTSNNPGGYHLVWPRDAVEAGFAFLATGHDTDARRLLDFLAMRQQPDGHWHQNFLPDGTPFWTGIQLDETALPILLAVKLAERGHDVSAAVDMIRNAVGYLVRTGPLTLQDRWEEDPGGSPFTLGCLVAALVAGAEFLAGADRDYVLSLADDWNYRIEEWSYVTGTWLDQLFHTDGHYVRIGPDPVTGVARITNQADPNFVAPSYGVLGLEFMYLARLGLRDAADRRLVDSTAIIDTMLGRNVGTGVAYYRYNYDGYGEQVNGANFVNVGVGRLWPLLAGERGHYALLSGGDGQRELTSMLAMRSPSGLVPEQVWDQSPLRPRNGVPSRPLFTGKPTLSATPLVWAHSELVKLIAIRSTGRPIEQLDIVAAHYATTALPPTTTYWRTQVPVLDLRPACDLVVEDLSPFTLHFGHDGWTDVTDRDSAPGPFGTHAVRLPSDEVSTWSSVQFRRRYDDGWDPIGDQNVDITEAPPVHLRRHSQ